MKKKVNALKWARKRDAMVFVWGWNSWVRYLLDLIHIKPQKATITLETSGKRDNTRVKLVSIKPTTPAARRPKSAKTTKATKRSRSKPVNKPDPNKGGYNGTDY